MQIKTSFHHIVLALVASLITGCTTYGSIENDSLVVTENHQGYSLQNYRANETRSDRITLVVAFSGGGSRAAALSYGVMKALRDAEVEIDGEQVRLLDQVDMITSVSGGSFTAAYFGLYGDQLFEQFEDDFLRKDYVTEWIYGLASPLLWFSSQGRTDIATQLYENQLFRGATFADLQRKDAPLILLNATDLGGGIRFSFIQEYFDLLCSDISSYPIARAVTASSAVPIMLNPVVLKNHKGCINPSQNYLRNLDDAKLELLSPHLVDTLESLRSYEKKDEREYIHLVDGGITDNLGLMAFYEMVELAGGIQPFMERIGTRPSERLVIISVNASAKPRYNIESTNEIPEIEDTINAVTDTQLHRYNAATLSLIRRSMQRWSDELGSWWKPVTPFLIEVSFDGIQQSQQRLFLNQIPTSLSLSQEQADALIQAGEQLLHEHPEFQRLLNDFE
ncbi:MAG TPA: patatin-like phospholipase family protein [Pseudidiomarina sp.]|nr:patatin-like phospholipase family protein [Pseudidiomarina sp.]